MRSSLSGSSLKRCFASVATLLPGQTGSRLETSSILFDRRRARGACADSVRARARSHRRRQLFRCADGTPSEGRFFSYVRVEGPRARAPARSIDKDAGGRQADSRLSGKKNVATEAKQRFKDDPLKLERIEDLGSRRGDLGRQTDGPFVDLCRGPTCRAPTDQALQAAATPPARYCARRRAPPDAARIYGHACSPGGPRGLLRGGSKRRRKRDHRVLGKKLDLFLRFRKRWRSGPDPVAPKGRW